MGTMRGYTRPLRHHSLTVSPTSSCAGSKKFWRTSSSTAAGCWRHFTSASYFPSWFCLCCLCWCFCFLCLCFLLCLFVLFFFFFCCWWFWFFWFFCCFFF